MRYINRLLWISDWRPNTLQYPAVYNTNEYPYYGGYDIHILKNSQTEELSKHLYVEFYDDQSTLQNKFFFARIKDFIGWTSGTDYNPSPGLKFVPDINLSFTTNPVNGVYSFRLH